jgi:hypothetical protein
MLSSELTKRRQGRVIYANYVLRELAVEKGETAPRPHVNSVPSFTSGVSYTDYISVLLEGTINTTVAERQAIIDAAYPPSAPPTPITPSGPSQWSYYIIWEGVTNYEYLIYNSLTATWIPNIDSGIVVANYSLDYVDWFSAGFVPVYAIYNPTDGLNDRIHQFVNFNGTVVRNITYIESYPNFATNFRQETFIVYYLDPTLNSYIIQLYNPNLDILTSITLAVGVSITDIISLVTYGVYVTTTDNINYTYWTWSPTQTTPNPLITTQYPDSRTDTGDYVVVLGSSANYWNTIYYISGTTTYTTYSLPSGKYLTDNGYNSRSFGINYTKYKYSFLNTTTSNYDSYIFNRLPILTPVVISNVDYHNKNVDNIRRSGYIGEYETGISDNFALSVYNTPNYNIYNGNVNLNNGTTCGVFAPGGGNQCLVQIFRESTYLAGLDSNIPNFYGEHRQLTCDSNVFFGYVSSKPSNTLHMTAGFVSYSDYMIDSSIKISAKDVLPYVVDGVTLSNNSGSYTTSNGRTGSYYYQQQYGLGGAPSVSHLWFTIQKDEWNSAFSDITSDSRLSSPSSSYDVSMTFYGHNFIVVKMLLSGFADTAGTLFNDSDIQVFLSNYVGDADLMSDPNVFTTLDMNRFQRWHLSHNYTSNLPNFFQYVYDRDPYQNNPGHTVAQGTIYFIPENTGNLITTDISGDSYYFYNMRMNRSGLEFFELTTEQCVARCIGQTVDISSNLINMNNMMTYFYPDLYCMNNYFFNILGIYKLNETTGFNTNIVNNITGDILFNNNQYFEVASISGNNTIFYNTNTSNQFSIFIDGSNYQTSNTIIVDPNDPQTPYYRTDKGVGTLFAYSANSNPGALLIVTSNTFIETPTPILPPYHIAFQNNNFVYFFNGPPFSEFTTMTSYNISGASYTYTSPDSNWVITGPNSIANTETTFQFALFNISTSQVETVMFNQSTLTWVEVLQPSLMNVSIDTYSSTYPNSFS